MLKFSIGLLLVSLLIACPNSYAATDADCYFYDGLPSLRLFGWTVPSPGDISSMAATQNGKLFVVDGWRGQVHRYSVSGEYELSFTVNDGEEYDAIYIAVDESGGSADGSIYVRGTRRPQVYRYDQNGNLLSTVSPEIGEELDEFTAGSHGPIAVDPNGYLYVVDDDTLPGGEVRNRIKKYLPGGVSPSVAMVNPAYPSPGYWIVAWSLSVADNGDIYLYDDGYPPLDNRIIVFNSGGSYLRTIPSPDGMHGIKISVDSEDQTIWVSENDDMVVYDLYGVEQDRMTYHVLGSVNAFARMKGTPDFLFTGVFLEPYTFMVSVYGREPAVINVMREDYLDETFQLREDDPALLSGCVDYPVNTIAADGAATVLHRINLPGPGKVSIELTSTTGDQYGEYASIGGTFGTVPIEFDAIELDGEWVGLFKHQAPPDYDSSKDSSKVEERLIDINWGFYEDQPDMNGGIVSFLWLARPPVMFVHGLWDRGGTWTERFEGVREDVLDRWDGVIDVFDYENTNGASVLYNISLLKNKIRKSKADYAERNMAVAQFDFIVHSMGGILLRVMADENLNGDAIQYADAGNMGMGDYNKIMFFDTPHYGSSMARLMHEFGEGLRAGTLSAREMLAVMLIEQAIKKMVGLEDISQIYGDAVRDLSDTSPLIASLGQLDVPSYAYVGVSGFPEFLGSTTLGAYGAFVFLGSFDADVSAEYTINPHDAVVLRDSQIGGFAAGHYEEHGNECGGCGRHLDIFDAAEAWQAAEDFVTFPMDSPSLQQTIPAVGPGKVQPEKSRIDFPSYLGEGFDIVMYDYITAGSNTNIQVVPRDGINCDSYFVTMNGQSIRFEPGDLIHSFAVPAEWVGSIEVSGLGITPEMDIVGTPLLTKTVNTYSSVTSLRAEPSDVYLDRIGGTARLSVYAGYSDGVDRLVTTHPDVAYTPSPTLVDNIYLDDNGTIVALAPCEGSISIVFMGRVATVDILVEDGGRLSNIPHARVTDNTQDGQYCGNTTVCFDASGSFDYDTMIDDSLIFSWDLNGDGVFDDGYGEQTCALFETSTDEVIYGVHVQDQQGNGSYAYGHITPFSTDCMGSEVVCEIVPVNDGRDYIEVGNDGLLYTSKGGGEFVEVFGADCTTIAMRDVDVTNEIGVDADGIIYYEPHYVGAPSNTFARLHPDGTIDELPVTGLVEASLDFNRIEAASNGDMYVDGRPYSGDRSIYRVTTAGEFVDACEVDWPNYFYISQFDIDDAGAVYVLISDSGDELDIVKYEPIGGTYQLDTSWGVNGIVHIDCFEIKDIAVSGEGMLCAIHSLVQYGDCTIDIYDGNGVLSAQRNAFSNGIRYDNLINFEYMEDGMFLVAPLSEPMIVTQLLDKVTSVDDGFGDENEFSDEQIGILGLSTGSFEGGESTIFLNLTRDVEELTVDVYNLRGTHVRTAWTGSLGRGTHELFWNNRDKAGRNVASGVYMVRMKADGDVHTGKIVILK